MAERQGCWRARSFDPDEAYVRPATNGRERAEEGRVMWIACGMRYVSNCSWSCSRLSCFVSGYTISTTKNWITIMTAKKING